VIGLGNSQLTNLNIARVQIDGIGGIDTVLHIIDIHCAATRDGFRLRFPS